MPVVLGGERRAHCGLRRIRTGEVRGGYETREALQSTVHTFAFTWNKSGRHWGILSTRGM